MLSTIPRLQLGFKALHNLFCVIAVGVSAMTHYYAVFCRDATLPFSGHERVYCLCT